MKAVRVIFAFFTAIALAISFVGAGLVVCTLPPVTHSLSWVFSNDSVSPFDRNQLATVADAARDYSFGDHDLLALYQAIYDVDVEFRNSVGYSAASISGNDFPKINQVTDRTSIEQLRSAFAGASEMYCFSQEAITHLDDCNFLARIGYPLVIAAAIVALVGLVFTGVTGKRRRLGAVLLAAGIIVILAFIGLAVWAVMDFAGLFATIHGLFFKSGSWQFPYDSLIICAMPDMFWIGMGALCLVVAFLLSLIAILVGGKLVRRKKR